MSGWSARLSVPFGPWTVISRPARETSTDAGTVIGSRPIRDIAGLPDVRQDFTTELGLVGLCSGHDSLAGANDNEAKSTEHPGDLGLARIHAQPGFADALEPGDDRCLAINVLERYAEHLVHAVALFLDFGDEAFL